MTLRTARSLILLITSMWLAVVSCAAFGDEIDDAQQLVRQGNLNQALERVNAYLASRPKDARARFLKGVILTEQNKTAEAIKVFTALTEDYPELPEPYNNLAVLYAQQQQYDKARHALEMAIQTHPSYATAHENLGDIYAKLASQAYDRALQLDKNNTAAQMKLSLIKEIFPINSRVQRPAAKTEATRPLAVPPAKPAAATPTPPAATDKAPSPVPVEKAPEPSSKAHPDATQALKAVQDWARAWSAQNVAEYLAYYGPDFKPPHGQSRSAWEKMRRERLTAPKRIQVTLSDLKPRVLDENRIAVTFRQRYHADHLDSTTTKTLVLRRSGEKWLIEQERVGS
ncbi:L,D-transpeptidase Cds6 family protein [Thiobacter aerophilum]|uniref:Tetratricopeptide repeat protein n=1 Tax=Thiobacter aerophilum TaxID=3121275 RepID=A0ABV0EC44_9BURK